MKYFNYGDYEKLEGRELELPEDRGEPELTPVRRRPGDAAFSGFEESRGSVWRGADRNEGRNADRNVGRNVGRKPSDPAAIACIRDYERRSLTEGGPAAGQGKGTVHALPRLVWEASEVCLELSVGAARQYVVRNLEEFCQGVKDGELIPFGKQFSVWGAVESFHADSRELIRFIMKHFAVAKDLDCLGNGYPYHAATDKLFTKGKRGMCLTPASLDEFYSLHLDQSVSVCRKGSMGYLMGAYRRDGNEYSRRRNQSFDRRLYLKEGHPLISLEVTREEGGVGLTDRSMPLFLKGEKHLYLYFEGSPEYFWRCDESYKQSMEQFLSALGQRMGRLFIAEQDMVRFCASMLTEIRPHVEFSGETDCLTDYTPAEMQPRVFLDSPSRNVVAAMVKADYNGVEINLYGKEEEHPEFLRNTAKEEGLRLRMERWFPELDPQAGVLYLRGDDDKLYDFVKDGQQELFAEVQVFITDRYRRMVFPQKTKVAARVSLDSQLLQVTFDFEGFPPDELLDALSSFQAKRRYHRLADGAFLAFEEKELYDALLFVEGMQLTRAELARGAVDMPKYRAMYLDYIMKEAETIQFDRDGRFRQLVREIRGIEDCGLEPPARLEPVLRDYQRTGFGWLATMARLGFGGILADDMGLGKTLEMISLLVQEADAAKAAASVAGGAEPPRVLALVVCPASLVLNWEQELFHFAPELSPYAIMGTAGERRKKIAGLQSGQPRPATVAITSYDLLKRDLPLYEGVSFLYHIVDEAQYIKNFTTQNAKAVKGVDSLHRFALTGTPVENRLSELWSIFDFLMPGFLGPYKEFKEEYELPILRERDEDRTEQLRRQIMPFILRRLKSKVLAELPEKIETVVCVPMEKQQRKIYLSNLAKVKLEIGKEIREGGFESHKIQILAMLTRLRQICCHPALCYENYDKGSGKMEACLELLTEAVDGGHRVLLFSQFTSMLSLLGQRLNQEGIDYYLLTGKTEKSRRQELVNSFNMGNTPVFLISLKAGGTGLNLTGADVVIHYDPWWNQAAQNQATDRAHRIGQKNSVQVFKLVAQNTIEEKIVKLQESKVALVDSVIGENSTLLSMLDERQLEELFL